MTRFPLALAVCAGLVSDHAGAATAFREVWSDGLNAEYHSFSGLGRYDMQIAHAFGGDVASLGSIVDNTQIAAFGEANEYEWFEDPGDPASYRYQIGFVMVRVSFVLPSPVYARVTAWSGGDALAVLEMPHGVIFSSWEGWLEPGHYEVFCEIDTEGAFGFHMDVPGPAAVSVLSGGFLLATRRRR